MFVQFLVMQAHIDEGMAFLLHELVDFAVVVSLVFPSKNEQGRHSHSAESVETTIDVSGFGVVDEADAVFLADELQAVLYAGEMSKALGYHIVGDAGLASGECGCRGVEAIVDALETKFSIRNGQRCSGRERHESLFRERTCSEFFHFFHDDRVALPVDEGVIGSLVAGDAHLGVHVVLETEVVAVHVVGRDVHEDSDVCAEVVHVVQLERTEFDHVPLLVVLGHL